LRYEGAWVPLSLVPLSLVPLSLGTTAGARGRFIAVGCAPLTVRMVDLF
jgi:hypothetical protein